MAILRVYSDLHLEFSHFRIPPPDDPNTILVLAGDIFTGKKMMREEYIPKWASMFKHVIVVLGNHDYYKNNFTYLVPKLKELMPSNVHLLEGDIVNLEGTQFVGGTMWTSFNDDPMTRAICEFNMNDYRQIRKGPNYKRISSYDTQQNHYNFISFLNKEVDWDKPTVVVTHHCPSEVFVNTERYKNTANDINYAYFTDLEREIVEQWKPKMWIAGHTHKRVDTMLSSTRLYSNPRGYETNTWNELTPGFKLKEDIHV